MRLQVLLAAGLAFVPMAGRAQPRNEVLPNSRAMAQCAPAAEALAVLKSRYDEVPFWIGGEGDGSSMILTRAPSGKSWTLLAIGLDDAGSAEACMVAAGAGTPKGEPTQ
jgi:hypothetical protein